ncbi:MAG: phosphate permease [Bacteroidetes bacterium CG18_big_fil_WC_8_21_14_2_50_41_14]|nr:MAG: phosphate permease [Bacteroidetes bacterium CG18_big_fil_WC_8_21_14_2_50_41_14]PJB59590.1 MAG: phosphate permease [Bacteroidetes bacterium CG_4_9_14_3_um_filter_41_19]
METFYLFIVILLFVLAASDLVVGVSNDAVNFLNSAIGSKVAPFKIIMLIAGLGVLVGSVFSSGMMEVARKGIFNPGEFYFSEIMLIFLAVMVTDVILLDAYNTIGLPTSTTVSIVFELLGAAVGMATIKIIMNDDITSISQFINSSKALAIISGILVSVVIAFTVGAIIQYFIRIVFSFNYKKRMNYFGSIWGGLSFTALTYFILLKGVKDATFMPETTIDYFQDHATMILFISLIGWTLLLQLLHMLFNLNILKVIVLVGTFSLAMAFAGNDLVNFIGVPLAGYSSWQIFTSSEGGVANDFLMTGLSGKVQTPILFLIGAGIIMVITLFTSKKAKSVVKTSLDLSRQEEGDERFKPSWFSKALVRSSMNLNSNIRKILPGRFVKAIERQFEPIAKQKVKDPDPPAFDLIRASVNLTVASILIALGTSLKLPLSTTYVTFMVAMGTSLSDKAWDRESAVYRISGVLAVIGGWFLTAFSAFTLALIVVYLFYFGQVYAIVAMSVFVIYLIYRSHRYHNKTEEKAIEGTQEVYGLTDENIGEKTVKTVIKNLRKISVSISNIFTGIELEDRKQLKKIQRDLDATTAKTKYLKDHITVIVDKLKKDSTDTAYYFVQVLDYMREMLHAISYINRPAIEHIENNHKPFNEEQIAELKQLQEVIVKFLNLIILSIEGKDYSKQEDIQAILNQYLHLIEKCNKNQIGRIKTAASGTKTSILFLNILNESKHLALMGFNLYKSQRDFVVLNKKLN